MRKIDSAFNSAMAIIAALAFAACGGDGDDNGNGNGSPDADPGPDAEVNTCTVLEADYGALGSVTGIAFYEPQDEVEPEGPQVLSIRLPLNTDAQPDVLVLEFFEEAMPFNPEIAVGTYSILDMQADIIACGSCAYIAADFDDPDDVDFHMASSGTLTIDTLDLTPDTGSITGTVADLKLRHVTVSGAGQAVTPGGCKTQVASAAYDFSISLPPDTGGRLGSRSSPLAKLRARIR